MIDPLAIQRLKALAEPTRLEIIEILARSPDPLMVEMIAARLKRPQCSISRHLKRLAEVGIVEQQKSGRCKLYKLVTYGDVNFCFAENHVGNIAFSVNLTEVHINESKRT